MPCEFRATRKQHLLTDRHRRAMKTSSGSHVLEHIPSNARADQKSAEDRVLQA